MANSEKPSVVFFEPKPGGPAPVRVSHGEYTREFQDAKWPAQADPEEWRIFLLPTGLFREAKATPQTRTTSVKKE